MRSAAGLNDSTTPSELIEMKASTAVSRIVRMRASLARKASAADGSRAAAIAIVRELEWAHCTGANSGWTESIREQ